MVPEGLEPWLLLRGRGQRGEGSDARTFRFDCNTRATITADELFEMSSRRNTELSQHPNWRETYAGRITINGGLRAYLKSCKDRSADLEEVGH